MAASEFHLYTDAFAHLDTGLSSYVLGAAANVSGAFTPVATVLLTLYVMLWGWAIMRSMISEPILDGLFRILRLSIITGFALNIGLYNNYVVDFLWKTPEALAGVIAQGHYSPAQKAQYLDTSLSQFYDYGKLYWAEASVLSASGWGLILVAFAIWACGIIVTAYAAVLLALAKISLALLLTLGPLFILTAIFEATKQFFNAWVGQALNAVFLIVLTSGVITLIVALVAGVLANTVGATEFVTPSIPMVIGLVVMSIIAAVILFQLPSISAALGGGLALSTLGSIGAAYNAAKRGASGGKDLMTGKTLNDKRAARRSRESNKRWAQNNPGIASKVAGAPKAMYRKITTRKNRVARG